MKVIIIEDESLAVERLRTLLRDYDSSIEVICSLDSVQDAVAWLQTHPAPDLIFLDIELADGKSFNIFNQVALRCPVVFTTAYDQYALDAFRLYSIDYLLKPVTITALAAALKKCQSMSTVFNAGQQIAELGKSFATGQYKQRFLVKVGSRMFFISNEEIAWFLAQNKNVFLVDREGMRYLVDYTLDGLMEVMDPGRFFRLNRQLICNVSAISEIKTYLSNRLKIQLRAGNGREEVIVSRDRVAEFKSWAEM